MNRPYSMAVDGTGNIHIADTFNSRLRVVSGGVIDTVAGNGTIAFSGDTGPAAGANFFEQKHVTLDSAGNLVVGDERNARVRRVNAATGVITTVAGTGQLLPFNDGVPATSANLRQPYSAVMDTAGNLYIADTFNHRVRKVDTGGTISTIAGMGTPGFNGDGSPATSFQLDTPTSVALDAAGNIYVADSSNHRIRKITPGGTISTFAGNGTSGFNGDGTATAKQVSSPYAVTVDSSGNVFIADYGNLRIRKVDTGGTMTTVAGNGLLGFLGDGGPATAALLNFPRAVAVDGVGNLIIADTGNNRVRLVEKRTGRITTVAGGASAGFLGDGGAATAALLNQPFGVAVNAAGRVFVSDSLNNRIRAMTLGTDIGITKDDLQASEIPGTSVSYTVRVTNNGPNTLTSVNVVDTVPSTLLGVSYAPASGTYAPGTGDWTGLSLGTGQSVTMVVSGTIASSATGSITNTVVVAPPLGLTDPIASNNQATDVDALNPEADVSIAKSAAPDPATLGLPLVYTLNVGNPLGPSDATNVIVTDTMPAGVTLVSATPPCTITGTTVTCALGTIPAGSFHPPLSITVIPDQTGTIVNTATVSHGETDSNTSNDTATATTVVKLGGGDTVHHLTVTSKDGENIVQWLNPMAFGIVRLRYRTDPTSCTFPTDPDGSDGSFGLPDVPGTPNEPGRYEHNGLVNGNYYCYTAWVNTGAPWSARRTIKGRPFQVLPGPGAKWGFNMGIFSMVPPGNGVGVVYSVANDGSLHAMVKGSGAFAGTWPGPLASLPVWKPQSMNGPSQGRPSGIPVPTSSSTRTIFLSSQDGHVYAFNAETGAPAWSPSSPLLAPSANLQAHPSGVFTTFGGTRDLIFVGTRDPAGSRFYALRLLDGNKVAPGWEFDGGAIRKDRGHQRPGRGGPGREARLLREPRVRCGRQQDGLVPRPRDRSALRGLRTPGLRQRRHRGKPLRHAPLRRHERRRGHGPRVRALRTSDGLEDWNYPIVPAAEGAPKGYVTVDRLTGDVYFSTATTVWALERRGRAQVEPPLPRLAFHPPLRSGRPVRLRGSGRRQAAPAAGDRRDRGHGRSVPDPPRGRKRRRRQPHLRPPRRVRVRGLRRWNCLCHPATLEAELPYADDWSARCHGAGGRAGPAGGGPPVPPRVHRRSGHVPSADANKVAGGPFSATQILDIRFGTLLRRELPGPHVLALKVVTPRGHLYQTLTVPFTAAGQSQGERMVDGYPRPLREQETRAVSEQGFTGFELSATLPVGGTAIVTNSLYGEWRVEPQLDGVSCGNEARFDIRP